MTKNRYIATKLHQALELAGDDPDWLGKVEGLPHYVIDPSLSQLVERSDVQASLLAMREAGIARLPFEALVVELELAPSRFFFQLEEHQNMFRVRIAVLHPQGALEIAPAPLLAAVVETGIMVETTAPTVEHEYWMNASGVAVGFAMMMLNVRGIEKEVIEPTRLNKGRKATGKPQVPRHTLMRIGHVYDRNGERVGFGTGRTMPVHMRSGHTRSQHHGKNNEQVKLVYIPPVLVNFRPGEEAKVPKRIVAA